MSSTRRNGPIAEIDALLGELSENRGYFPREAVNEAIRRKAEITPHLLRALEEGAEWTPKSAEDEASFLPVYAMFVLAQFREPRAFPLVVELCKLPEKTLDALIGDTITEGLPRIIASVFDGDTAPIKSVVADPSVYEFVRGSALRSLAILAYERVLSRTEVIAYFGELFRGGLEKKASQIWNALASEAVDLHANSLANEIRTAYEEGLVWPGYMSHREVERTFAMPEETVLSRSKERHRGLINDVVKEMEWWACFKPDEAARKSALEIPSSPASQHAPGGFVRPKPKAGRNAPCPCGSGRKYKKCCGAG